MKWLSDKDDSVQKISIKGLSEREFLSVYNVGKVLRLNVGDNLLREGRPGDLLFLVLKGSLAVREEFPGGPGDAVFREGDWIGEGTTPESPDGKDSLSAREPSLVLALDPSALQNLDPGVRTFVWRKLHERLLVRTRYLEKITKDLIASGRRQGVQTRELLRKRTRGYEQSEIILSILKNVPRLPMHVSKLVQVLSQEGTSAREVTQLAKEDPSLVGEILKTVNSAYYGLQKRISDLSYAIVYLGFNQVYQIVVSSGLRKAMPRTPRFEELYEHSVVIAHLAFEIGQLYDRRKSSTMSTIALLHEIGESVVLLLKAQNPRWSFFIDMLEPSKVAAMLLKDWNLPDNICETVEYQYYPEFLPPGDIPTPYRDCVAVLYLAHAAFDCIGGGAEGILDQPYLKEYLQFLNMPETTVGALLDKYVLTDLNMKIHTLPKHVQSFILKRKGG